jgi:hypothetical protein
MNAEQERVMRIIFPHAMDERALVMERKAKFVHYTRAEAALNIINSKSIWLRKPQWMNDYREIEHGRECLIQAYRESPGGKRFAAAVDKAFPGIMTKITTVFDSWIGEYQRNTYVACLSIHDDAENYTGRLSMWRAYGNNVGVALVVKSGPFTEVSGALGAYSSPVAYLHQDGVNAHFDRIASAIEGDLEFFKTHTEDHIQYMIHEAFRFAMICNKHPGFAEEKEWRVIYSPARDDKKILIKATEIIGGVPQPVFKIPLKALPGYEGIALPAFIDRVIIGPARFPEALRESFTTALEVAGVQDAGAKVVVSEIPLRT